MWPTRLSGNLSRTAVRGAALLLALAVVAASPPLAIAGELKPETYIRLGIGAAISDPTSFEDADCASTTPAALFGCGKGSDGRRIGAYGDFGTSVLFDAGLGHSFNEWLRAEATLSYRPGLEFSGHANFLQIPKKKQPVHAGVESLSVMATGYLYPGPLFGVETGPVNPFLSAGLGVAHNRTDKMVYEFPTLGGDSVTITQRGSDTDFAWSLGAGFDVDVTRNVVASFAYRFSHLGHVRTNAGDARIVRSTFDVTIPVGETEAPLTAHEVFFSLRYAFTPR